MTSKAVTLIDQFPAWRSLTPARVRLDPTGGPIPLSAVLDFQLSHAKARDAIHQTANWDRVRAGLSGRSVIELHSRAGDRATYIRRPDLGRRLSPDSLQRIATSKPDQAPDLAIVVADGLSASAIDAHACPMIDAVAGRLADLKIGPIALVHQGRVAVGDEVAHAMGAALCLTVIGERPGLSVADSLGAYLTWNPVVGTRDNTRNCISNIHARGGLSYEDAGAQLAFLVRSAMAFGATGVALTTALAERDLDRASGAEPNGPLPPPVTPGHACGLNNGQER